MTGASWPAQVSFAQFGKQFLCEWSSLYPRPAYAAVLEEHAVVVQAFLSAAGQLSLVEELLGLAADLWYCWQKME